MFESVLYFVLGFLCSALIALMISPAIWNRAVILTKKRIESSVPLTLNEIQADKDQLRAEFAMSTRKLELSLQELQDTTSQQVIEINRKRDELAKLSAESREKIQTVETLDAQSAELRNELTTREGSLESTTAELHETRAKLEKTALELEKMRSDADSSRIELVAKQTALEDHSATEEQLAKELLSAKGEIKALKASMKDSETADGDKNSRLTRLQKTNTELEAKIKELDTKIANYRKTDATTGDNSAELISDLTKEKAKSVELEAKLATTVLRMEALLEDASNANVKKAMATMNQDRDSLKDTLKSITKQRDDLKKELEAHKYSNESSWDEERRENATLRERINDLAAQVTAMTAALEGPDSPINEILGKDASSKTKRSSKKADSGNQTLADRIKALQESARIKEA